MTSKCGKNKKVAHKVQSSFEHIMTSSVICYNDCTHLRQQGIYLLYKMKIGIGQQELGDGHAQQHHLLQYNTVIFIIIAYLPECVIVLHLPCQ